MAEPERPYKLEWYGQDPDNSTTPIDITEYVSIISKFTDVGTGEIVSATIMFRATEGALIADASLPQVQPWDVFKLTLYDDDYVDADNSTHIHSYWRYLIADARQPQESVGGDLQGLELFGRERYLQKMPFPGHYYFIRADRMIALIVSHFNDNNGTAQPNILERHTGDIGHTNDVFEFGADTSCYDALMDVVNRLSLSVAAGGAGEYYGLRFYDHPSDITRMGIRVVPQGYDTYVIDWTDTTDTTVTLATPTLDEWITVAENKEPERGNIMMIRGQVGSGSFPIAISKFRSLVEEYENLPEYDSTERYNEDAWVRYEDRAYQCTADAAVGTLPTTAANWDAKSFLDYIGGTAFHLSPWTAGKATLYKNIAGGGTYPAFMDANAIIRVPGSWRDWVWFRTKRIADIPASHLYGGAASGVYHGLKLLIDGNLSGSYDSTFTGNDKRGRPYANSIVILDRDGDWLVLREAEQYDQVAVRSEKKVYEYNRAPTSVAPYRNRTDQTSGLLWRDMSAVPLGNDCFHTPSSIENVPSLLVAADGSNLDLGDTEDYFALTDAQKTTLFGESALKIEYTTNPNAAFFAVADKVVSKTETGQANFFDALASFFLPDGTVKTFTTAEQDELDIVNNYQNMGWWATLFETPFPVSTQGGIGEGVGEVYGGTTGKKRPFLDLQNLNNTPSGEGGYGHDDSDEMGPLDGIAFLLNLEITGFDFEAINGDIPVSIFIEDGLSNVHRAQVKYRLQGDTQFIRLPWGSFNVYRARVQPAFRISTLIEIIRNAEIKPLDVLEKRLIRRITIQVDHQYDERGAFDPLTFMAFMRRVASAVTFTEIKYTGIIDMIHFFKTPVAIARDDTKAAERHLVAPPKRYGQISNTEQLRKIAESDLDIALHRANTFSIKTAGRCDIKGEQFLYLKNADLILASETDDGTANTRRLIVKKTTYSVNVAENNSGLITALEVFRKVAT